jgi:hypothetical protein
LHIITKNLLYSGGFKNIIYGGSAYHILTSLYICAYSKFKG